MSFSFKPRQAISCAGSTKPIQFLSWISSNVPATSLAILRAAGITFFLVICVEFVCPSTNSVASRAMTKG
ncbi:MAG: hypothetical protein CO093_06525 [Alphaproteobacteria bacterium CG_4_9_14_3_um_filter_47_13]|nr:MAG: hypothetical protein CO093_06525 [Alphaproteobacteria bacterium CG_4_9_14_3_um_filter_47_13]